MLAITARYSNSLNDAKLMALAPKLAERVIELEEENKRLYWLVYELHRLDKENK